MVVEEKIGIVTDYLDRIGVAVIRLTDGDLGGGTMPLARVPGQLVDAVDHELA